MEIEVASYTVNRSSQSCDQLYQMLPYICQTVTYRGDWTSLQHSSVDTQAVGPKHVLRTFMHFCCKRLQFSSFFSMQMRRVSVCPSVWILLQCRSLRFLWLVLLMMNLSAILWTGNASRILTQLVFQLWSFEKCFSQRFLDGFATSLRSCDISMYFYSSSWRVV